MTALEEIKKALEGVGPLKVEFTPDCDEFNAIIAPINDDYDGTFFTVIGCGDKQDKLGGFMAIAVNAVPELLSTLESFQRENEELRRDRYDLAYAITGGEDAPGLLDSVPTSQLVEIARETHRSHSADIDRAMAAEARVKSLEEALKPFAEYMGDHFDKDNHGDPLPDDLGVGWIYLTHADFRRARTALASTGGEHNAE